MLRFLTIGAFLALLPHFATADDFGPGFGSDAVRPLTPQAAFAAHDTLSNGNRVMFNGQEIWIENDAGTVLGSLGFLPIPPAFASFIEADPSESFAVLGESSNGGIYEIPLTGGTPTLLTTLAYNYDIAFESSTSAIVSAATCGFGCGNSLYRVDLSTSTATLIAQVSGPSGPIAFSSGGTLNYAIQSDIFPTPPGAISIVRWSAAQVTNGPYPLGAAQASVFAAGLDGAASMVFDPTFGDLFVSESIYLGTSRVSEFDRFGAHVATAATSLDTLGKVEIVDVAGSGAMGVFQPAGRALKYRTTDFNQGTSEITTISPRRPTLTSVQNGNGTMTCTLTGGQPNSTCLVISGSTSVYSSVETGYDLSNYLFWSGIPFANIRRAGVHFATDANGQGSFTFNNPPSIQGTRVLQALVRDVHGVLRASSTAAFN